VKSVTPLPETLVFFSGHGKENKDDFFYVVSCRAHADRIEGQAIAAKSGRVLDQFTAR